MSAIQQTTPPSIEPITVAEAKAQMRITISDDDAYIGTLIAAARRRIENITGRRLISQTCLLALDTFPGDTPGPFPGQAPQYQTPPYFTTSIIPTLKDPRIIVIPIAPVSEIGSIKTVDADGAEATMSASDYVTDFISEPARIRLKASSSWPVPAAGLAALNGVRIAFTVGYGASSGLVAARAALTAAEALVAAATAGTLAAAQVALADAAAAVTAAETAALSNVPEDLVAAVKLLVAYFYENREDATTLSLAKIPTGVDALITPYKMWQRDT